MRDLTESGLDTFLRSAGRLELRTPRGYRFSLLLKRSLRSRLARLDAGTLESRCPLLYLGAGKTSLRAFKLRGRRIVLSRSTFSGGASASTAAKGVFLLTIGILNSLSQDGLMLGFT